MLNIKSQGLHKLYGTCFLAAVTYTGVKRFVKTQSEKEMACPNRREYKVSAIREDPTTLLVCPAKESLQNPSHKVKYLSSAEWWELSRPMRIADPSRPHSRVRIQMVTRLGWRVPAWPDTDARRSCRRGAAAGEISCLSLHRSHVEVVSSVVSVSEATVYSHAAETRVAYNSNTF